MNGSKKNMDGIRIGLIIQARTGSTRLPNKILMDFYEGQSILGIILKNIKETFSQYPIILATSTSDSDAVLGEVASLHSIEFFQGSENNFKLTHVVRICSDNPFLSMNAIKDLIDTLDEETDYTSYSNHQGTPVIKTHIGLFAEIVSVKALVLADKLQNELLYQEHVTNYIYGNPDRFNVKLLPSPAVVYERDDIRLTLDDSDDFTNLSEIYSRSLQQKDDLPFLVSIIDADGAVKEKMIKNIKKYTK